MSAQNPEVSVVMPVYNGEAFLYEAISSILSQTFENFELIVVNDASTDETYEILTDIDDRRLVVLSNEKQAGVPSTLNRGIAEARASLIARMDADDISEPTRLERQVAFMKDHPEVVLCGSEAYRIDGQGRVIEPIKRLHSDVDIRWHLLTANPYIHPSVIYRTEAVRRIGGYDTKLWCAQDYDLWCRLVHEGRCANLPDRLVRYRFHQGAISANKRAEQLRITRACSEHHLQKLGIARNQAEAAMFVAFSGRLGDETSLLDYDRRQWQRFPEMVDSFFSQFDSSHEGVSESIARCRERLRRKLLGRINLRGFQALEAARLLATARKIDPSGVRLSSVSKQALSRVWWRFRSSSNPDKVESEQGEAALPEAKKDVTA